MKLLLGKFGPGLALGVLLLAGQAMAARKEEVALTVDPGFFDRKIERIAILDVTTPSGADDRVDMIPDMVQAAVQDQGDFHLLFMDDLKASAERSGVKEAYDTILRVWHARRELDPPSLTKLQPVTLIDALLTVDVTHFEQHQLEYTEEGNSTTTVGLKVQMYDTHDRRLLWQASLIKVAKSVPYNPNQFVTSDAGGVTRQGIKGVPEPPEYDDVTQEVVDRVIGTFPKEKEKEKDGKKKPKENREESKKEETEKGR